MNIFVKNNLIFRKDISLVLYCVQADEWVSHFENKLRFVQNELDFPVQSKSEGGA